MSVERIIGIDFGTSTSVIRVKRYKDGKPVNDRLSKTDVVFGNGSPMVPTLIQRTPNGTYYGYEAEVHKKGEELCQNFKVKLESKNSSEKAEARALTEEFFKYLAKEYTSQSEGGHLGESTDTERTIVSYPVKWSAETKSFMVKAAQKAGFKNVEGLDEAQASIHAVTVQSEDYLNKSGIFRRGVPCNILLIDMGAGTTDLVMCRHTPGSNSKTEILCTWPQTGNVFFGGSEVDSQLRSYIGDHIPPEASKIFERIGIKEYKTWKETVVSPALEREEVIDSFNTLDDYMDTLGIDYEPYNISRNTFENSLNGYLLKFPQLVNECIRNSKIKNSNIDLVILTGGHSQWYFVEKYLTNPSKIDLPKIRSDKRRILKITRPQETVALGLVYRKLSPNISEPPKSEPVKNSSSGYSNSGNRQNNKQTSYKSDYSRNNSYSAPSKNNDSSNYNQYRSSMNSAGSYTSNTTKRQSAHSGSAQTNHAEFGLEYYRDNIQHLIAFDQNGQIYAVRSDGSVVCENGRVLASSGIKAICSNVIDGEDKIYGLTTDGTVKLLSGGNLLGRNSNTFDWRNIKRITANSFGIVGLQENGSFMFSRYIWEEGHKENNFSRVFDYLQSENKATDIIFKHGSYVCLRNDGTVAVGESHKDSNRQLYENFMGLNDVESINLGLLSFIFKRKNGLITVIEPKYSNGYFAGWNSQDYSGLQNSTSYTSAGNFDVYVLPNGEVNATNYEYLTPSPSFSSWHNVVALTSSSKEKQALNMATGNYTKIVVGLTKNGQILKKQFSTRMKVLGRGSTLSVIDETVLPWKIF